MAYTCRYSSGPLIPNSATATVWNVGINCPQKYLQESATTLVSLRFIYIIPIVCKITKFSLLLFVHLFENILLWLVNSHIPLQKKTKKKQRIHQELIIGKPMSQYARTQLWSFYYTAMNSMKSNSAIHPDIMENTGNSLVKWAPHIWIRENYNISISAVLSLFYNQGIVWEVPLWTLCFTLKSLCVYHKSSPTCGCEERIGHKGVQR